MVVKIKDPINIDVKRAANTAKLVMKKVVIVLEPKKFNNKKVKVEAEEKISDFQNTNFVDLDVSNDTLDTNDDVFLDNNNIEEIKEEKNATSIPDSFSTKIELFSETDPFLDDNQFELDNNDKLSLNDGMPLISNIGTVKPNNMLSEVENASDENSDIILPTMGLSDKGNVEVPIVSENYIN